MHERTLIPRRITNIMLFAGTHYIQDISVSYSDLQPGQINISCSFIVNSSLAMGYMTIVVHSHHDTVHYLITENQDEGKVINKLTGLNAGEYSVLLYTIDEHGVPLKQAAGFPQTVFINQSSSYTGMLYYSYYLGKH